MQVISFHGKKAKCKKCSENIKVKEHDILDLEYVDTKCDKKGCPFANQFPDTKQAMIVNAISKYGEYYVNDVHASVYPQPLEMEIKG